MYPGKHVVSRAEQPAFIMAETGEAVTYAELERRSNRLAHLLRARGLRRLDHYAIFMENNARYVECCTAGIRSGLYFTCVNSYLTAEELAYIVDNSRSKILISSMARRAVALAALEKCPRVELCLLVDGPGDGNRVLGLDQAISRFPDTPIADEALGTPMLYSSGTTGRPKGVLRPLPELPPWGELPLFEFLTKQWRYREGMVYLSPAPLYHAAPQAAVSLTIRVGGTAVIMERFDPERFLQLVEKYRVTHSQLVPTMFSRMLKLPEEVRRRYDLSSLECAVHAAAPCPIPVKEQMIEWWGPIIDEYYGATEGLGFTACDSAEWLAHKGTVGRVLLGKLHVLDEGMQECPIGKAGTAVVRDGDAIRIFQRSGQDRGSTLARRHHEHGWRCRLCRWGRLRLSDGPRNLHDHLGGREYLSAGNRKFAHYTSQGCRCGRVRRAQCRPR